jgi:hypothetical protein
LRKLARGQDCQIRIPGFCNFDRETTVGCHGRGLGGAIGSGIGIKARDLFIAWGCSACHAIVDGDGLRLTGGSFTNAEIHTMFLEAILRTQAILIGLGVVQW